MSYPQSKSAELALNCNNSTKYYILNFTIIKTSLPIHFVLQAVSCNKQSSDTTVHILDSILYKFDFLTKWYVVI